MSLNVLQSSQLKGIQHGFFTREGGISTGLYASLNAGQGSCDDPDNLCENRDRIAIFMGVQPDHLLSCYQVHSSDVVIVDEPWDADNRPKADAMVTNMRGVALGILTADCGPVLFADAKAGVIGAAHAGWKGALGGVLENTVVAMERLGAKRGDITACLGMMISQKHYEVGAEFIDTFLVADEQNNRFFALSNKPNHHLFDLSAFITSRLQSAGVGCIDNLDLCTYADEQRFFSYRRTTHRKEPDYGRHISAIALV